MKTFTEINKLIQSNDFKGAKYLLESIDRKKISRKQLLTYAQLARRLNLPLLSLQSLSPFFKAKYGHNYSSDEEKIEYSASLIKLGMTKQADYLLEKVTNKQLAQKYFFQAMSLFPSWDYANAIGHLKNYLKLLEPDSYQSDIAKVNLLASYIYEKKFNEARIISNEIEEVCLRKKQNLLLGNTYELKAQLYFYQNKLKKAQDYAKKSLKFFENEESIHYLFALKWLSLIDMKISDNRGAEKLKPVYELAKKLHHYETLRSLDYFQAQYNKDKQLMSKVFWGTSHQSFRDKIMSENDWFFPSENYTLGNEFTDQINLNLCLVNNKKIKPNSLDDKLLTSLASEQYRPKKVFQIFQEVYDEFYNPDSSKLKMYQLISRFNKKYIDQGIRIEKNREGYTLKRNIKIIFKYSKTSPYISLIKQTFGHNHFNCEDFGELAQISPRTALRILNKLYEQNMLNVYGTTKGKRYSLL